ncbi:MAG: succinyl-diaminopimelate desuccinylase [Alphaproteobacteria bacterium]|nr:succinyl-diaminopimelate desuccinylase [Alphaproteobacteria bacterium]
MTTKAINPVELLQELIRCPSVTPKDEGAQQALANHLESIGFKCTHLIFSGDGGPDTHNLYARLGTEGPNLCFAGHTDVVPAPYKNGLDDWKAHPFAGEIIDGELYGRGAVDMKGGIACFTSAVSNVMEKLGGNASKLNGSISLLITGDEEATAVNGTPKLLKWLEENNIKLDACITGEPSSNHEVGDAFKIGRRGSMNAKITVHGISGHVGHPDKADNPIHRLSHILTELLDEPIDKGTEHFQPSSLAITTIDVGNPTVNVIPSKATAGINIRFNDRHTSDDIKDWINERIDRGFKRDTAATKSINVNPDSNNECKYSIKYHVSGEAFLTSPGALSETLINATKDITGKASKPNTGGGTSDSRFIKDYCPVLDLGLINKTMHQTNERTAIKDVETLTKIYQRFIERFLIEK